MQIVIQIIFFSCRLVLPLLMVQHIQKTRPLDFMIQIIQRDKGSTLMDHNKVKSLLQMISLIVLFSFILTMPLMSRSKFRRCFYSLQFPHFLPNLQLILNSPIFIFTFQAERSQRQGGMVRCATILILMCFVMLVLLVLKEILFQQSMLFPALTAALHWYIIL